MARVLKIVIAVFLALMIFVEVLLGFPITWWIYLAFMLGCGLALSMPNSFSNQYARIASLLVIAVVLATLYLVPWTTRKPFLHDLYSIQPGMTEAQAREIMTGYMEGTGWPPYSADEPHQEMTLDVPGFDAPFTAVVSEKGDLMLRGNIVFRHSNDGSMNSDWGVVTIDNSKVVSVAFSRD